MQKVLVVDDSMLIRHTVCRFLEERGFQVVAADDGLSAMRALGTQLPDLIITDMQMPGMGGLEFMARLKQREDTAGIPVVVLTGKKRAQAPDREDGAAFVIYKDIDIEQQLERVVGALTGCHATP